MNTNRSALLIGATGLVGGELLERLLAADNYTQIHVLGRRDCKLAHRKLRSHVAPLERVPALADESPEIFTVDDVFCCLGTTIKTAGSKAAFKAVDYGHVLAVAKACERHGAQRFFLVSAVGANPRSGNFYSRVKGETEVAVSQLAFRAVYWIRPSLLLGERSEHRPGEAWAQRLAPIFSPLLAGPLRHTRPVTAAAVADHILRLTQNDESGQHISYPSRD